MKLQHASVRDLKAQAFGSEQKINFTVPTVLGSTYFRVE